MRHIFVIFTQPKNMLVFRETRRAHIEYQDVQVKFLLGILLLLSKRVLDACTKHKATNWNGPGRPEHEGFYGRERKQGVATKKLKKQGIECWT